MEGLIFLILLLAAYIAIRFRLLVVPAIKRIVGYPTNDLKGTFLQTDFLIRPKKSLSPFQVRYEITQAGMITILEIDALAEFDSLGREKYLLGKLRLNRHEFFRNDYFGPYGVIANLTMRQDFSVEADLDCSPEVFELVMDQLKQEKPLLIRVPGRQLGKLENGEQVASTMFNVLLKDSISGPEDFCAKYATHVANATDTEREKLKYFDEAFHRNV